MNETTTKARAVETRAADNPTDHAYRRIRELIMSGSLLPNSHILESAITSRLSVLPGDVHEAAVLLEAEGLVQPEPRGGFWITPVTPESVLRVCNRLSVLETRAACRAATQGMPSIEKYAMEDAIRQLHDAAYRGDATKWATADHHFHRALLQAGDSSELVSEAQPLLERVHRVRMLMLRLGSLPTALIDDYEAILNAITEQDVSRVFERNLDHWNRAAETFMAVLDEHHLGNTFAVAACEDSSLADERAAELLTAEVCNAADLGTA